MPGESFHIYNRTNNKDPLFLRDDDRYFFLDLYHRYLAGYLDNYCWCLMINHFHFLSRIKGLEEIKNSISMIPKQSLSITQNKFLANRCTLDQLLTKEFSRFYQAYAVYLNSIHIRKGNLFNRPFKRVAITSEEQLQNSILYIHTNPVKHLNVDFIDYKWTSWDELTQSSPTRLLRQECFEALGGKENFVNAHHEIANGSIRELFPELIKT